VMPQEGLVVLSVFDSIGSLCDKSVGSCVMRHYCDQMIHVWLKHGNAHCMTDDGAHRSVTSTIAFSGWHGACTGLIMVMISHS
jgi:hypothetical protein